MIKVTKLTKVYKSKRKDKCIALNNLSFSLGDHGFVFVIGKSGSGKTTLLSILGGLDNLTKGDVDVYGNEFYKFKEKDFVNYRNSIIGYIFQDFHLIDELTVYENIKISLDLQNDLDIKKIYAILEKVGLKGYANRYPRELSGGEKQRVAIARALIKDPKIIFADEPTGNLDSKTTEQILSILKELSKDRLVVIVSHNLQDARNYADRIIELSNGKIIQDLARNSNYSNDVKLINNELFIPVYREFNDDERAFIEKNFEQGKINKITQVTNLFVPSEQKELSLKNNIKISNKHFSFANLLKLGRKFLKKDFVKLFFNSFIVACLMVILGLSQLIVNFDSNKIIEKELQSKNYTSISLRKDEIKDSDIDVNNDYIIPIADEEKNEFIEAGYEGNIYELTNLVLDYGTRFNLATYHRYNPVSLKDIYYNGTRGTLITTDEYLEKLFGKIEYVALADKIEKGGIYITDYSAHAMLLYKNNYNFVDEKSLLGWHKSMNANYYAYVNGIIKTGYDEKYKSIIEKISDSSMTKEEFNNLSNSEEFQAYYDDVIQNLAISYTTNPNFKKDFINSGFRSWVPIGNSLLVNNGKEYEYKDYIQNAKYRSNYDLNGNEVIMGYSKFNSIFNTNYNVTNLNEFEPMTVTLKYYDYYDIDRAKLVYSVDLNITKLIEGDAFYVSDEMCKNLLEITTFTTSLYFDDLSNIESISKVAVENGYIMNSLVASALTTITKAVNVFSDFFIVIFVGLCLCAVSILANYGLKLVKERKYEIGILKALGTRDRDLVCIFGIQIILEIILIVFMYNLGSILFVDLSNDILIRSLMELAPNNLVVDVEILFINLKDLISNSILAMLIVIVSFVLPIIKLRKLKPLDIVKAKE